MDQKIERIALDRGPYGEIIRAVTPFSKGEAIFYLSGEIVPQPTKYTIQLDADRHVLTLDSLWKCMNHGCTPNVRIDADAREMVAARDIAAGEELNFNYNTTEWSMTSPFPCGCGSPDCAGDIRGFRYLTEAQREKIRPFVSPYIRRRWAEAADGGNSEAVLDVLKLKPEVNILIPYAVRNGQIVSPEYDTEAFKAELRDWFEPLGLTYVWRAVTHDALADVIGDLVQRAAETPIVVLNLCDGIDEAGTPGLSVVKALTAAGLPFSGANCAFYDTTTSKLATKRLLQASGVPTGKWVELNDLDRDIERAFEEIGRPLFVKPDMSAGSFGIGIDSVCYDADAVRNKVAKLRAENFFNASAIFAEPFIEGREFTALVVEDASQPLGLYVLPPGERVFDKRAPANQRFLAYERYWELPEENRILPPGEPYYWYAAAPAAFAEELSSIARRAVRAVDGAGYARVDIRRSDADGRFYVLEVNAQCGLSGDDSATCGSLLKLAGRNIREVIVMILNHALNRSN